MFWFTVVCLVLWVGGLGDSGLRVLVLKAFWVLVLRFSSLFGFSRLFSPSSSSLIFFFLVLSL